MSVICRILLTGLLMATMGSCGGSESRLADGSAADWDAWQGKWLVVNYWAEWCAPCRKEIPELNELHAESPDVIVLGVNFDGVRGEALGDLVAKMNIEFPVLEEDPRGRWNADLPTVLPSTLVIDPSGALKETLVGPQTFESLARAVNLTAEM